MTVDEKILTPVKTAEPGGNVTREADGYVRVSSRLNAWWDGVDTQSSHASDDPSMELAFDASILDQFEDWSDVRTKIAEVIWGQGFINPGTRKFSRLVMAPARVTSKKSILDLTAGLGGTAAMLVRETGAWVDALEPNPTLAEKGRRMVASAPTGKQIDYQSVDFHELELPERRYHLIYSRERLFATRFKRRAIEQSMRSLKTGGQMLLTDYVITKGAHETPDVRHWRTKELEEIHPWTMEKYNDRMTEAGLKASSIIDMSKAIIDEVNMAWRRMLASLESGSIDRELVNSVLAEGEIWQSRIKAMRSGNVQLLRINATRLT